MTCRPRLLLLASLLTTSATLAQNAWVNRNASPPGQRGGRLVDDAARQQSLRIGAIACWDAFAVASSLLRRRVRTLFSRPTR